MRMRSALLLSAIVLGVTTVGYVGVQAVQEDVHMRPGSPLAWLFVDESLWALDPPQGCERVGHFYTVGDGPKLPGSDTTLRCAMDPEVARRWASDHLLESGFVETAHETPWIPGAAPTLAYASGSRTASIELYEDAPGSILLRVSVRRSAD